MAWVRIDDKFAQHPKVLAAGPLGMALHIAALCHCNQYLTDGFVSKQTASNLLRFDSLALVDGLAGTDVDWPAVVEMLVCSGLWEPVDGGWVIHDYLEYQPSRKQIQGVSEARRKAGRKGGRAKQTGSKPEANAKQKSSPSPNPNPTQKQQPDGYAVWELWQARRKHHGHGTDAAPPSAKVLRMGTEWIEAGADLTLIRQAFDAVLGRKGDPPRSLAYCDGAVRDALKAKPKPAPTFEAMHAGRVRTYEATGFWDSSWGPQPEAA